MKIFTFFVFFMTSFYGTYAGSTSGSASAFGTNNIVIRSFQATTDGQHSEISWSFDKVEHAVTCLLQRSADGNNFTTIQSYEISANFYGETNYIDKETKPGINYYRLYIVKRAFAPHSSNIISIKINANGNPEKNYRVINPFTDKITISGDFTRAQKLQVEVIDMSGRVKMMKQLQVATPGAAVTIDANKISTGMYIIRLKDMGVSNAKPVMARCVYKNME